MAVDEREEAEDLCECQQGHGARALRRGDPDAGEGTDGPPETHEDHRGNFRRSVMGRPHERSDHKKTNTKN